jgi:cytidylate kinase
MPVITLSRELGSRGDDIAAGVAKKLNLRLVGRGLLNQAARQAGVPEVALAEIDELGLIGIKPSREALQRYRLTVEGVMSRLADAGNIMPVGRGSQIVLAGRTGVLHVRIVAPLAVRVRCVQERCHVSVDAAAARIDASDHARAGYLRRSYGARWNDPLLYDLVLNTAHWTVESAVDLLSLAAQQAAAAAGETGMVQS